MNFLSLEYFLTVAEERSFHGAARRLFLSDQSISEAVKRLEEELDTPLFNRTRPLSLTPAGEVLQRGAKDILRIRRDMVDEITDNYASTRQDVLMLGVNVLGAPSFLPDLLLEFQKVCPDCRVEVVSFSRNASSYPERVNLFFLAAQPGGDLRAIHLKRDRLCVLVQEGLLQRVYGDQWEDVCARMEEEGEETILRQVPRIQPRANHMDDVYTLVSDRTRDDETSPKIITDNKEVNVALCINGLGLMVAPEDDVRRILNGKPAEQREKMRIFPLKGTNDMLSLDLCCRKGRKPTRMEKRFIALAREFLSEQQ